MTVSSTTHSSLSRKLPDRTSYIVLFFTICTLVYFCFTVTARGDEGTLYYGAFKQAHIKFPHIDMSPFWPVSSFYLWVITAVDHILPDVPSLAHLFAGRIFSTACWVAMFMICKKINNNEFPWGAAVVLFNPYLLVYATRAHPLVPGLLLFLIFWIGILRKKNVALILFPFAVNFQVFIGGAAGLFVPQLPLKKEEIIRFLGFGALAVSGVLLTWLTWGGIYPKNFYESDLYKHEHLTGSPTFQYPIAVLFLAGLSLWFGGQRSLSEIKSKTAETRTVLVVILVGCILLAILPDKLIGTVSAGSKLLVGSWSKFVWITIYGIIGLGWLRVHRDRYTLLFSLLGSGILLITLPYFYERISFFATFAPCLAWSTLQRSRIPSSRFAPPFILTILTFFSALYQFFGAL
jgi:hypothetical protein